MTPSTLNATKWTVDDYHRMIEAGILSDRQVELLNGVIVDMAPEGIDHADLSDEAAQYLRGLLGDCAKVREAKPITLANRSEPEPDLCICQNVRYNSHHPYPEDVFWVIEYADSSLRKDLEEKNVIYAAAGILEYWVVNLRTRELIVFRDPQPEGYTTQTTYTAERISPLAFPEVAIAVSRLLNG
ncbi:MAG: Uma2 family endonuclease [Oculatellaceae cyanobacterium bins.114]|nr:Uma2 family endonuclease [Oculatellaceae cyanobacterium bins.114]